MESTIVIKVRHGETLRRSSAHVNEAGRLDLDMDGLRKKVIGLFNFASDADLTLTYVDEDGDVVTLVDEEDLCDVMRQSLDPLRITVKLNAEKGGRSYAKSSGNSTPMRSPRVVHPLQNWNSSVSELLKSVPEPFRETISKLSLDLASKAASSAPGFVELVDCVSKMGQMSMVGSECGTQGRTTGSVMGATSVIKENEGPRDDGPTSEVMPNAKSEEPSSKTKQKGNQVAPHDAVGQSEEVLKKSDECHTCGETGNPVWVNLKATVSSVPANNKDKEVNKSDEACNSVGTGTLSGTADTRMDSMVNNVGGSASNIFPSLIPVNECPFSGMPLANESAVSHQHFGPRAHPFKRSYNHSDGMGSIFHRGVRCDGCGVHPITGPRFKSKVKEDYDLCSICFSQMGNEADYIKMDRPVSHRHPYSLKGFNDSMHHPGLCLPAVQRDLRRGWGVKQNRAKLDSRFIKDVNVLDGTMMAPATSFTKIWRMRNNGAIVWPQGTQLVWIGGDKLSDEVSFELQIPFGGIPVENELDVAVDFISPKLPGRYISYWRMASPSGQKFGQRVWVLIQVEASLEDSFCNSFHGINLNLPPEGSFLTSPENINSKVEPTLVGVSVPEPVNFDAIADFVEQLGNAHQTKDQDLNVPIMDTSLLGGTVPNTVPSEVPTSVSYPTIDLSEVKLAVPPHMPSASRDVPATVQRPVASNDVEQSLLKELEEMGFKQIDLNKEILRMNEYDLEQSVDDLCGVAEWDPILEELQEMGFTDNEVNKRLLKKNNGSIKRVVMDLITGEEE